MTNEDQAKQLSEQINTFAETVGVKVIGNVSGKREKKSVFVPPKSLVSQPPRKRIIPKPSIMMPQHHSAVQRPSPQTNWEHQQAVNAWLRRNTADKDKTAIFFTLKFHRKYDEYGKRAIDEAYAAKLVSKWLNRLDRLNATKREVERGSRFERVVFKQKGFSGENLHWHGVLLTDGDADLLLGKCKRYWQEERGSGWVDAKRSQFEIARHNYAVSAYAAHEVYKLGVEDSWSLEHTNMPNDGLRIAEKVAEQSKHKMLWLRELRMVMGTIITYLHLCEEKNRGNNNLPKDKDWATKLALLLLLQAEQHEQSSFI